MTPPPTQGFTFECQSCGAPVGFVLGAPAHACPYCNNATPLSPQNLARLNKATETAARLAVKEHRRLLSQRMEARGFTVMAGIAVGSTWLVMGGPALLMTLDSLHEKNVSAFEALRGTGASADYGSTWALFALIFGVGLCFSTLSIAFAKLRLAAKPPLALPPLTGGAPRCHLCGAELGTSGTVRTCGNCGTNNLIAGKTLKRHVSAVGAEIDALLKQETEAADEAGEASFATAAFASLWPLLGTLVAYGIGDLSQVWWPELLWSAVVVAFPGFVALVLLLAGRRIPRAQRLLDTKVGAAVRIKGRPYRVLSVQKPPGGKPEWLRLLAPEGTTEAEYAVWLQEFPKDACWAVKAPFPTPWPEKGNALSGKSIFVP